MYMHIDIHRCIDSVTYYPARSIISPENIQIPVDHDQYRQALTVTPRTGAIIDIIKCEFTMHKTGWEGCSCL